MKRRRRAEIVFEASRTTIYTSRQRQTDWCPSCGTEAEMITAFEAARFAGVSASTISDWAATGRLHQGVTAAGARLICLKSLSA